jgi:hypothetical protein
VIGYDVPDEIVCKCGWSEAEESEAEFREDVRRRCEALGFDSRELLREPDHDGNDEAIDGFLRALEKDD